MLPKSNWTGGSTDLATPSNGTALSGRDDDLDYMHDVRNWMQIECQSFHQNQTDALSELGASFCNASHDQLLCWPPTLAGQNASQACPIVIYRQATRYCLENGEWGAYTHYNECFNYMNVPGPPTYPVFHLALRYVYLVGFTLSLALLLITLFIFCYFKALQCTRIAIHKNLVVSFILKYICMIIHLQPLFRLNYIPEFDVNMDQESEIDEIFLFKIPGFCRTFLVLMEYFSMANIYWMFVEGLYLTSRIAVAVFSTESNFKVYLAIGWLSPMLFVIPWAVVMKLNSTAPCWDGFLDVPYIWIIRAPVIAALLVNTLFLINIIRILITKLRASNTMETNQMRKAVKAVAVLFPLLGLTNIIFFWNVSDDNVEAEKAFQATNAVLQSLQGVFVAVIYCFMNTEVRKLVKRKVLTSLDEYGKRTPRRSHQYHTSNGSCGVPTTSEVVMAVSYRRSTHDHSTTIVENERYAESKPLSADCGDS